MILSFFCYNMIPILKGLFVWAGNWTANTGFDSLDTINILKDFATNLGDPDTGAVLAVKGRRVPGKRSTLLGLLPLLVHAVDTILRRLTKRASFC